MIQIIGWLACMMLFIYSVRFMFSPDFRHDDGRIKESAGAVTGLGILAAIGFAVLLGNQGAAMQGVDTPDLPGAALSDSEIECITNAKSSDEVLAC